MKEYRKNQFYKSQLKSTLKRKAEGLSELQMVIEEAKIAVNTRDQRISDLEVALQNTVEGLSRARWRSPDLPLESDKPKAKEQIPSFNSKTPTR